MIKKLESQSIVSLYFHRNTKCETSAFHISYAGWISVQKGFVLIAVIATKGFDVP